MLSYLTWRKTFSTSLISAWKLPQLCLWIPSFQVQRNKAFPFSNSLRAKKFSLQILRMSNGELIAPPLVILNSLDSQSQEAWVMKEPLQTSSLWSQLLFFFFDHLIPLCRYKFYLIKTFNNVTIFFIHLFYLSIFIYFMSGFLNTAYLHWVWFVWFDHLYIVITKPNNTYLRHFKVSQWLANIY